MQEKLIKHVLIKKSKTTIDIEDKNFKRLDFFIIDVGNINTELKLKVKTNSYQTINVYIYFVASHKNKHLSVTIDGQSNSTTNVNIKNFANDNGNIKIDLIANAIKGSTNIVTNQIIDGVIFDDSANIKVIPSLIVDTNAIKATHAVNIGNINPEQLFYLMSRRVSKTQATHIIIQSMLSDLNNIKLSKNNIYNYVTHALTSMLKAYEKH
jgi:Fe-S cluster assembly protein SufD